MRLLLLVIAILSALSTRGRSLESTLNGVISQSSLARYLDDPDQQRQVVENLDIICEAPARITLRNANGWQYGVRELCSEQLASYPTITTENIAAWMHSSSNFLDAHARETWLVGLPTNHSVRAHIRRTALSGLPVLRRFLLAHFMKAWLTSLGRQLSPRTEQGLSRLVTQLYDVYRESVVRRGVLQYFHISKTGGGTWNNAARDNDCLVPATLGAHVRGFGDECRWVDQDEYVRLSGGQRILWGRWGRLLRPKASRECWQRFLTVLARGYSYFSNEYTLVGGMHDMTEAQPCPQFVNVVTLRDPLDRLASALRFIQGYIRLFWERDRPSVAAEAFTAAFCDARLAFWRSLAPPVTDNYLVRSFLGERAFHTPPGGLGTAHVAAARQQLLQFDLVLDLGAGDQANDRMVQQGLGWPTAWSRAEPYNNSTRLALAYDNGACQPLQEDLAEMIRQQGPDRELYSFGRVVNLLDELWLDMTRALGLKPLQPDDGEGEPRNADGRVGSNGELGGGAAGGAAADAQGAAAAALPAFGETDGASGSWGSQRQLRCGMLWRGSRGSDLARLLEPTPPT